MQAKPGFNSDSCVSLPPSPLQTSSTDRVVGMREKAQAVLPDKPAALAPKGTASKFYSGKAAAGQFPYLHQTFYLFLSEPYTVMAHVISDCLSAINRKIL